GLAAADRSGAEGYRLRCMAPLAEATGSRDVLLQADRILREARLPAGHAWVAGADAYLALGRAWLAAGEPERAAAVLESLVGPAEATGWAALVRAAGAYELLERCGHSSPARRAATRSAPSEGTGT
ncbi:MAG: hypothetical protein ACHQE5_07210, partial [Actinomycetes bacterium]